VYREVRVNGTTKSLAEALPAAIRTFDSSILELYVGLVARNNQRLSSTLLQAVKITLELLEGGTSTPRSRQELLRAAQSVGRLTSLLLVGQSCLDDEEAPATLAAVDAAADLSALLSRLADIRNPAAAREMAGA
jgi:hypothetical protein